MIGGQDADAQVKFLFTDGDFDPTVLRSPPLGDVELGKDFDA